MLSYEEFKNKMKDNILSYLPEKYQEAKVAIRVVKKMNEPDQDALLVMVDDMSPMIYLGKWYKAYLMSEDFEKTMQAAVDGFLNTADSNIKTPDLENSKDRIIFELVNADKNEEMLENVPHRMFFDMALVYRLHFGWADKETRMVALINNEIANAMQLNEADLYELAKVNTPKINPVDVGCTLYSGDPMWHITNDHDLFGAAAILYEGELKKLAEKLNDDLYLMPSCVHEFFVFGSRMRSASFVKKKVKNANRSGIIARNEILSDNAFIYRRDLDKIEKL